MAMVAGAALMVACGSTDAPTRDPYTILLPENHDPDTPTPLVMFFHGHGRSDKDPGNSNTIDLLLDLPDQAGVIVAIGNGSGPNWGNDQGQADYSALHEFVIGQYAVSDTVFLAASMGGLPSLLLITEGSIPVAGWYGMYPVTNLAAQYAASHTAEIEAAYGFSGSGGYAAATSGHDPNLLTGSTFASIPVRMSASPDDTLVDQDDNAIAFAALVNGSGGSASILTGSGAHGAVSQTDLADVLAFIASVT